MTERPSRMPPASKERRESTSISDFRLIKTALEETDDGPVTSPIFTRHRLEGFRQDYKALIDKEGGEKTMTIPGLSFKPEDAVTVTLRQEVKKFFGWANNNAKDELKEGEEFLVRILNFKDVHGRTATITLYERDDIKIVHKSTVELVGYELNPNRHYTRYPPALTDSSEVWKMKDMQAHCPLSIGVEFHALHGPEKLYPTREQLAKSIDSWTEEWEQSDLRKALVEALEPNAKNMPEVKKIVCFGLGYLFPDLDHCRAYIQHLAARDIGKILEKGQTKDKAHPHEIKIYAQDPRYREVCIGLLEELGITTVDAYSAEGILLIDEHTFIVEIAAGPDFMEPAVDIAFPNGPAGYLSRKVSGNKEQARDKAITTGPVYDAALNEVSDRVWKYRESCAQFPAVTDAKRFGFPPSRITRTREIIVPDNAPQSGEDSIPHINYIIETDENGQDVMSKFDTELLLRRSL
ncbi:hypothetical protein P280DRAFT_509716 [Massarina eburnea CBS 473.64]|uniref:SRR1-like domain-containing protein n=1 Tax=Massarina eburnea CBS 473.64 TaxID=1395130 RepID=A0A6A6RQM3_9PLEO|nr:hypothetical protein P280DRAFT_509716 [Massarina eburnea CBS 473.64]